MFFQITDIPYTYITQAKSILSAGIHKRFAVIVTDFRELSCYSDEDSFLCSICSLRTCHVEGIARDPGELIWVCPECYRKTIEREPEQA